MTKISASNLTRPRTSFHGVLQILRFNWSQYVVACLVIAGIIFFVTFVKLPIWIASLFLAVAMGALYFILASLVASWIIYDYSPLCRWEWLNDFLPDGINRWMVLHTGLDEISPWLRATHPGEKGFVFDIFDPKLMTEKSIRRARKHGAAPPCPTANWNSLPQATESVDTVLMILAVHEFRDSQARDQIFCESFRTLRNGGQLLLVEHLRDPANFAVFGPGFFHFWSYETWIRAASDAGFHLNAEQKITPWIHVFLFRKGTSDDG